MKYNKILKARKIKIKINGSLTVFAEEVNSESSAKHRNFWTS
jgi:hypothetical protein